MWTSDTPSHISAGGFRLECAHWGPPPDVASTIVLLHEGLGCVALWRDFPAKLSTATGWGVIAYSRAGYGQSDTVPLPRPLDYMTREATDVLPDVLRVSGVKECVLLGHSDGATIASIFAGQTTDPRLRGLVLMAPHYFTEPMGQASIAKAKTAYETTDLRGKLARYHANVDAAFRGWNDAWLDPGFASWNVAEYISNWNVPALAIQGTDDEYGTTAQLDEINARSPAEVKISLLPDCVHAPHMHHPDSVLTDVTAFLAALPAQERV